MPNIDKKQIKDLSKKISKAYWDALKLFNDRRGTSLAASSSFYIIITLVPFFLLLIRLVGLFLGDVEKVHQYIFEFGDDLFPDIGPEILLKIKSILAGPLFGKAQFTVLNFLLLLVSSLSFFNAIWSGLFLISGDRSLLSPKKHLKGIVIIGVTISILVLALSIQPIFIFIWKIIQNNFIVDFLFRFESLHGLIQYFQTIDVSNSFSWASNYFFFLVFLFYFTFVYRWFFNWKIRLREAFLGAGTFVFLLLIGKNLFWIYFLYVREGLIQNYGDYYTFIIAILWIFLVMCFFFYSACLCFIFQKNPLK
ncbi:MAG: hypothetical protein GY909_01950 [Oligoflexia bacterium]|nr:hypothetical protein [Oligoflexia bacterium]